MNLLKGSKYKNSIKGLGNFISKKQKKILCYSYVLSYIHKTEKRNERVIRLIHSDYDTEYFTLLKKQSLCTLYAKRLENICIELYKIKTD